MSIIFFCDTETTGFGKDDDILQIAYMLYDSRKGEVLKTVNSFFKTEKESWEKAEKVNGITKEFTESVGVEKTEESERIKKDLEKCLIFASYGVDFDYRFVKKIVPDLDDLRLCKLCLLGGARSEIKNLKSYRLESVLEYLGYENIENIEAEKFFGHCGYRYHDARCDVVGALKVYEYVYRYRWYRKEKELEDKKNL